MEDARLTLETFRHYVGRLAPAAIPPTGDGETPGTGEGDSAIHAKKEDADAPDNSA